MKNYNYNYNNIKINNININDEINIFFNINVFLEKLKKCKLILKLQNINLEFDLIYQNNSNIIKFIQINIYNNNKLIWFKLSLKSNNLYCFYFQTYHPNSDLMIFNLLNINDEYIDNKNPQLNNITIEKLINCFLNINKCFN